MKFEELEKVIADQPICQYGFLETDRVLFSEKVRYICENECERFNHSWSCPPAVGTVAECQKRCRAYSHVLIYTTLAEVTDTALLDETLATRAGHEEVTRNLCTAFRGEDFLALSSESCNLCEQCTWPNRPCRYLQMMLPCIESHGILVTETASLCDIDFFYDSTTVTWFGMIFFHANE